jgi:hypothetical protein
LAGALVPGVLVSNENIARLVGVPTRALTAWRAASLSLVISLVSIELDVSTMNAMLRPHPVGWGGLLRGLANDRGMAVPPLTA